VAALIQLEAAQREALGEQRGKVPAQNRCRAPLGGRLLDEREVAPVAQRRAPPVLGVGADDQPIEKRRVGVRRGRPVARLEVHVRGGLDDEAVEVAPALPVGRLQHALGAVVDQAEAPPRLLLGGARSKRQGLEQAAGPETDVGEPIRALRANAQHEVLARANDARSDPQPDPGQERLDLRAARLGRGLQQEVLLEAVPAAARPDELALDVLDRQRGRNPPLRVEVLEGNRGGVRAVDLGQAGAPGEADPLEIGVEIEHGRNSSRDPHGARGPGSGSPRSARRTDASPKIAPHWPTRCHRAPSRAPSRARLDGDDQAAQRRGDASRGSPPA